MTTMKEGCKNKFVYVSTGDIKVKRDVELTEGQKHDSKKSNHGSAHIQFHSYQIMVPASLKNEEKAPRRVSNHQRFRFEHQYIYL